MAVSPRALLQRPLTEKEAEQVQELVQEIDPFLKEHFQKGIPVCFPINPHIYGGWVLHEILQIYKEAGWTRVDYEHHAQDSTHCIRFEYRP